MSKVEVDLNQLAAAVSAAILQFAQPTDIIDKPKKKRGGPIKQNVKKVSVEELDLDDEEEVNQSTQQKINNDYMAPAKNPNFTMQHDPNRNLGKKVPFKKKKRINQFNDDLTLSTSSMYDKDGKKLKYPPHTEPRPEQKKSKYKCEICSKKFMAFPSYIPPKGEGGHQPQIRCYSCNTK